METRKDRKKNFAGFITSLHEDDSAEVETLNPETQRLPLKSDADDTVLQLSSLNEAEQQQLQELEAVIRQGLDTYLAVGSALSVIQREKLYRGSHLSLKAYVADRFGVGRQRAYQLIEASQVVNSLIVEARVDDAEDSDSEAFIIPKKESHASALASIPKEHRKKVWDDIVDEERRTGKAITAKKISEKAEVLSGVSKHKKAAKGIESRQNQDEPLSQTLQTSQHSDETARVARLRAAFANAQAGDLMLQINGRLLLAEQVGEDWQAIRQNDRPVDETFTDSISFSEALESGFLDDLLKKIL